MGYDLPQLCDTTSKIIKDLQLLFKQKQQQLEFTGPVTPDFSEYQAAFFSGLPLTGR